MRHLLRVVGALSSVLFIASVPVAAQTIAWDANTESNIAGYFVSYGNQSGAYTTTVDVGAATTFPLVARDPGLPYYVAVRAYTTAGETSDYSAELALPAAQTTITSLTASSAYPLLVGTTVTWTVAARSDLGNVEYAFWMYGSGGWTLARDYSSSSTLSWTPGWGDAGAHAIQVWARTVGSSARYEAFVSSGYFDVRPRAMSVTADVDFPIPPKQPVKWTAVLAGAPADVAIEYEFWLYSAATRTWTALGPYATSNTVTWTPSAAGAYLLQVWARRVGSTAPYETYASFTGISVAPGPIRITSFAPNVTLPSVTGTTITWTARATGGSTGPLQYAFWRYRDGGAWTQVQAYSSANTYTWTPSWGEDGRYTLQVWVRSGDSAATYEQWTSGEPFVINRANLTLTSDKRPPVAPGATVTWTAAVAEPSPSVEYQFWLYEGSTGRWSLLRGYSTANTIAWTPVTTGRYAVQVWARSVGSTAALEAWRGSGDFDVATVPVSIDGMASTPDRVAGIPITWTVTATGGSADPLQYQFCVYSAATGWTVAQAYSTSATFTWTPPAAGSYAVQVWVRSAGSAATYEAWTGTGFFQIH